MDFRALLIAVAICGFAFADEDESPSISALLGNPTSLPKMFDGEPHDLGLEPSANPQGDDGWRQLDDGYWFGASRRFGRNEVEFWGAGTETEARFIELQSERFFGPASAQQATTFRRAMSALLVACGVDGDGRFQAEAAWQLGKNWSIEMSDGTIELTSSEKDTLLRIQREAE